MKKQNGFSAVAGLLVVLIIAVIGSGGYYVWSKQDNKKTENNTDTSKVVTRAADDKFINLLSSDNSVKQLTPADVAKTEDQTMILTALHDRCGDDSPNFVTIKWDVFDGEMTFKQDKNHARISARSCDTLLSDASNETFVPETHYLAVNNSGKWAFSFVDDESVDCKQVDNTEFPLSIISSCYDEDNMTQSRTPKTLAE